MFLYFVCTYLCCWMLIHVWKWKVTKTYQSNRYYIAENTWDSRFKSIHIRVRRPVCRVRLTLSRWLWRRWRWRWRWWWSSRGGTFPPSSRWPSSSPRLVAQILLQLPSWRWTAELLLRVPSRQKRWLSSFSVRRGQSVQPRSHNRRTESAGWWWWRSCWQKTIWASLPPPHTAWNIQISLRKVWKKKNLHSAAKESNKKDDLFHLERCLVSRTLTQPVKILLLYSE